MTHSTGEKASRACDNSRQRVDAEQPSPAVLSFNASDPTGAGGVAGDALTIASVGAHPLPVVTGIYLRDTRDATDHVGVDDAVISEQARLVAEDAPLQAIKVGFAGNPEAVAAIAAFVSDYPSVPVITYMPDLSWWDEQAIDNYQEAVRDLLLPQTTILVGNNTTLRHWLLPESASRLQAGTNDLARAAAEHGVACVLVTGLPQPGDRIGNVLASPQAELCRQSFERIDAGFLGAGDILSAALAGLLAMGLELGEAAVEALQYLDQALDHGYHPGMGHAVADRLFWAATESDDDGQALGDDDPAPIENLPYPFNETRH